MLKGKEKGMTGYCRDWQDYKIRLLQIKLKEQQSLHFDKGLFACLFYSLWVYELKALGTTRSQRSTSTTLASNHFTSFFSNPPK